MISRDGTSAELAHHPSAPCDALRDLPRAGVYHPAKPIVRADRILRIQGYTRERRVRPAIREAAERCANDIGALIDPVLHYRRVPIRALEPDRLAVGAGTVLSCAAFVKFFAGCTEVVVFVLTLGPGVDDTVAARSAQDELLDAVLLETAGWLCIEACTKSFADALRRWAIPSGLNVATRMGPGYSYRMDGREVAWSLDDQAPPFALFAGTDLPVTLLESCAMMPKMSRSGLFGLAPICKDDAG